MHYYMPGAVSGQDEQITVLWYDGAILPAQDMGSIPQVHRSCFVVLSHIINSLLTKLARPRWLDIRLRLLLSP